MEHNDNEQIVKIENIWFQEENLTIESHWRCTEDVIKYKVNFGHRYMMMNKYYAIIKCKVEIPISFCQALISITYSQSQSQT